MMISKILGVFTLTTLCFSVMMGTSFAKSEKCRVLETNLKRGYELVGLDEVDREAKAIKRAISVQSRQLKQERQNFKTLRCKRDVNGYYRPEASYDCPLVEENIKRMRYNLQGLKNELSYFKSRKVRVEVNPTYTRREMEKAGCFKNKPQDVARSASIKQRKITRLAVPKPRPNISNQDKSQQNSTKLAALEATSGTSSQTNSSSQKLEKIERKELPPIKKEAKDEKVKLAINQETYRTMCVRTCDGYYFEVSKSTLKNQFSKDQAACDSACPAAKTELFFYKTPEGQIKNMTSVKSGIPYRIQSYAYRFRDGQNKSCACKSTNKQQAQNQNN